ncbi:MAG: cyclic nucleotide-binding domain-containing protein [Cyclobacteriaceae bacterium]|nr:cyclic nucleotide-binding domain-containing protein [Cyclobacteriaceae bacterium]
MNDQIINGLKASTLFGGLKDDLLEGVARGLEISFFNEGCFVVREGDPSDALFVILNGIVAVKKSTSESQDKVLAYLMAGDVFGEVGILDASPRSASVVAISNLNAVVIPRDQFMKLMYDKPDVAIQLARVLANYLTRTNIRLTRGDKETRLIAIIDVFNTLGASDFSRLMALKVAEKSDKDTVLMYSGFDSPLFNVAEDPHTHIHIRQETMDILKVPGKMMMTLDKQFNEFDNIVLYLGALPADGNHFVYEHADQLIFLGTEEDFEKPAKGIDVRAVMKKAGKHKAEVFKICLKSIKQKGVQISEEQISTVESFVSDENTIPGQFKKTDTYSIVIDSIVDRLDRNNRIGIIIPSTYDVNIPIDPGKYVEETLSFLGSRFGGATCEVAQGIWNSTSEGLVGEQVFLVHSYTTKSELRKYLDEVVEYVRGLKMALKQEAMALEVNRKLTLI